MAKNKEAPPIQFEGLDGEDDDRGSYSDPVEDFERNDPLEDEESRPDPRAGDPFAGGDLADDDNLIVEDDDGAEDEPAAEERQEDGEPEANADDLKAENERLKAQLAELEQDRSLSRKRLADAQKELYEGRAQQIDSELDRARKSLRTAIEEGDTEKQIELHERLDDLLASKRDAARALKDAEKGPPEEDGAAAGDDMPKLEPRSKAAEQWMQGRSWINDPRYRQANRDLLRISKDVYTERYNPDSADYFAEVGRRMARLHPDLFRSEKPRAPGRQIVSRVSRDDPPRQTGGAKGKVVLTADDQKTMQLFGLDPTDPNTLRQFAAEKRALQRRSASKGARG